MAKKSRPRYSSLQYWPRKRISKSLPRVNWLAISSDKPGLLGYICYKVSMASVSVLDKTPDSMTKNKKIIIPATILECPNMGVFSVRFYKSGKVAKEVIVDNDKILKKILKVPKQTGKIDDIKDYEDIRVIAYSKVNETGIKKTPDMTEIGLGGTKEEKMEFVKNHIGKDISFEEVIEPGKVVDSRGLTKGKGLSGPVKRFHIGLRSHKAEKGQRRPGSLGPWHPARVTFRTPMAGQLGMFTRIAYNSKVLAIGKISEKDINKTEGFKHFGKIKTNYVIVKGSVHGPVKREVLLTKPLRLNKSSSKLNYEFVQIE